MDADTINTPIAAPATGTTVAPNLSENLTRRTRARRFAQNRAAATKGSNGTSQAGKSSTPANPKAQAESQRQPTEQATSEETLETQVAPSTATNSPAPTADDVGAPETAETAEVATEGNPLALLEDLDGGELGEGAETEAWLRNLDEILKGGDQPKAIKEMQKRIHALVDQRDIERNGRLEAERRLTERPEPTEQVAPTQSGLDGHPVIQSIDQQIAQTEGAVDIIEAHLETVRQAMQDKAAGMEVEIPQNLRLANGDVYTVNGKPVVVTQELARKWLRDYQGKLSQLNARRETTIAELGNSLRDAVKQNLTSAMQFYPWLGDKSAPEFIEAQTLLKQRPGMRNDPSWPMIVGDYISGKRAREAKALKPTAPAMTRPRSSAAPPPAPTQRAAQPPPASDIEKQVQAARDQYRKTGSVKDRAKLSALQRQQRTAA